MRGKILCCVTEFEEGGVGGAGLLAKKGETAVSEFQGFVLHLLPHFGDISPCGRGQGLGEEGRRCQQLLDVTQGTLCFGGSSLQGLGCCAPAPAAAAGPTFPAELAGRDVLFWR